MNTKPIALAALAAASLALAGCATGGVPTGGSGATALDPDAKLDGEITVWSWDVGAVALERLAADFEKEHEGTTVNVVDVGYAAMSEDGSGGIVYLKRVGGRAHVFAAQFRDGLADALLVRTQLV